jgi:hypothetical protein
MCAAVLTFEALLVLFAIAPAIVVSHTSGAVAGIGGPAIAVLCVLAAGMLRRRSGYLLAFVLQVVLILCGLATPLMWVLGTLFAALFVIAYVLGGRLDAEKAVRKVAQAAWDAEHPLPAAAAGTPSADASAARTPGSTG